MLNWDLFLSLCEKYGVDMDDQYDHIMIKEDNKLHKLSDDDIRRVLVNETSSFGYYDGYKNTSIVQFSYVYNPESGLAIAC